MSPTTRIAIKNFWEIAAFIINSLIFLMIGTHTHISELWSIWPFILGGFAIVTAARAISCYSTLFFLKLSGERLPGTWQHIINWGGIHGSIPVALALGIPDMPHRTFIVDLVFGIVFLSLTVQGLTMGPLVRMLGLAGRQEDEEQYEQAVARSVMLKRALDDLKQKRDSGRVSEAIYDGIAGGLEGQLKAVRDRRNDLENNQEVQHAWENRTNQAILTLQKSTLYEMLIRGDISYESADQLMGEIDEKLEKLESEEKF
jgi:CPA1 family monovalent cation:H+ antiporter